MARAAKRIPIPEAIANATANANKKATLDEIRYVPARVPVRATQNLAPLSPRRLARGEMLPVDSIRPNPMQPRGRCDEKGIRQLTESLRTHGALQPILVRSVAGDDAHPGVQYEIIAGERRWRAAKVAGWTEISAIVLDVANLDALELALVENLHREDLNPIDKAHAFKALHDDYGQSHAEIGARMGEDCKTVGNTIRLLGLGKTAQGFVKSRALSPAHGKALLGVKHVSAQSRLAREAAKTPWSLERLLGAIRRLDAKGSARSHADSSALLGIQLLISQAFGVETKPLSGRRAKDLVLCVKWPSRKKLAQSEAWMRKAMEKMGAVK